MLDHIIHSNFL